MIRDSKAFRVMALAGACLLQLRALISFEPLQSDAGRPGTMLMATLPSHHSAILHANVQVLLPTRELVTDHIFYKSGNRTRDMLAFRTAFAEQWLLGMTDFQVCQRGFTPCNCFKIRNACSPLNLYVQNWTVYICLRVDV